MQSLLVTGGAGFIGANFVHFLIAETDAQVINLDKLTYASNLDTLAPLRGNGRHVFVEGDIGDRDLVRRLLGDYRVDAVVNFAAESHVDRSIQGPAAFIETNVVGTFNLLDCAREYWAMLGDAGRDGFRFLHVSTDEVYGSLGPTGRFVETTPYAPQLALCGLQGGLGPSGAGLASHLWAAGADDQLLQQLWSLPVSRKADPAGDSEGRAGGADSDLRGRRQCAGLALCHGPLPRHPTGPGGGASRGGLQRRGNSERTTCKSSTPSAPCPTSWRRTRPIGPMASSRHSSPTGRDTTGAMPSTRTSCKRSWDGSRRGISRAGCGRP